MGWFFNRNNSESEESDQTNNKDKSNSGFSFRTSYSSQIKTCKNDPEDSRFLICKTVIRDKNGRRQIKERVPANSKSDNDFSSKNMSSNSQFRNKSNSDESAFDKLQSFMIHPSFYTNHSSSIPDSSHAFRSFYRSSSKSETCKADPQDNEYLICKQRISDESGTRQTQKRVKKSSQFNIPSFAGEFSSVGHEIDKEMNNFAKQINLGFKMFLPFFGSFMNFAQDMENLGGKFSSQQNQPHENFFPSDSDYHSQAPDDHESQYYNASQDKKDTSIYDL